MRFSRGQECPRIHRFGGTEFRFSNAEAGHLHENGTLDIPFPRAIRDELLSHGLVEEHRWVPGSGWATLHIRETHDLSRAVWLMRLSYLRFALKATPGAQEALNRESEHLQLTPSLHNLLAQFLPRTDFTINRAATEGSGR